MEKSDISDKLISQFVGTDTINAMSVVLSSNDISQLQNAADSISTAFGSDPSFKSVCASTGDAAQHLITSFHKNLTLLIQKTWVEKSDEQEKEQVLYKLEQFCSALRENCWMKSYTPFFDILDGVVYLMFGAQSKSKDFEEYALRIDPEFGIFWWYVQSLPQTTEWQDDKCRVVLLLGMYFLANY